MTEKGNDAMLPAGYDPLANEVARDDEQRAAEQAAVDAQPISDDEPGTDYPDPDAAPEEES
jgi:hypothetical protein